MRSSHRSRRKAWGLSPRCWIIAVPWRSSPMVMAERKSGVNPHPGTVQDLELKRPAGPEGRAIATAIPDPVEMLPPEVAHRRMARARFIPQMRGRADCGISAINTMRWVAPEGAPAGQWASSQLGPVPASTLSGTRSVAAPDIRRRTSFCTVARVACGTSSTSSSCTCMMISAPVRLC